MNWDLIDWNPEHIHEFTNITQRIMNKINVFTKFSEFRGVVKYLAKGGPKNLFIRHGQKVERRRRIVVVLFCNAQE